METMVSGLGVPAIESNWHTWSKDLAYNTVRVYFSLDAEETVYGLATLKERGWDEMAKNGVRWKKFISTVTREVYTEYAHCCLLSASLTARSFAYIAFRRAFFEAWIAEVAAIVESQPSTLWEDLKEKLYTKDWSNRGDDWEEAIRCWGRRHCKLNERAEEAIWNTLSNLKSTKSDSFTVDLDVLLSNHNLLLFLFVQNAWMTSTAT